MSRETKKCLSKMEWTWCSCKRKSRKFCEKKPKKVLVNINADFCNTGRVMTQTTFVDTLIASYINKNLKNTAKNPASKNF